MLYRLLRPGHVWYLLNSAHPQILAGTPTISCKIKEIPSEADAKIRRRRVPKTNPRIDAGFVKPTTRPEGRNGAQRIGREEKGPFMDGDYLKGDRWASLLEPCPQKCGKTPLLRRNYPKAR